MKNLLITSALIISTASAASAFNQDNDVTWSGTSGTVEADGCKFGGQSNGTMARNGNVWETTRAATIQVRTRGQASVEVTSDNALLNADGSATNITATVDYTGAGGMTTQALTRTGTGSITSTSVSINGITGDLSNLHAFHLGGTATMTSAGAGMGDNNPIHFLANDADYKINHIVTCTQ